MTEQVAVLSTWQSEFKLRHPSMTYVEQAQEAAAGCMAKVSMCPDDIDAIVYSLAPTAFMGVADADRWAIDHIFGAGKPMLRVPHGDDRRRRAHLGDARRAEGAQPDL
jgi:acetyl-CoA C-acetyltransferase